MSNKKVVVLSIVGFVAFIVVVSLSGLAYRYMTADIKGQVDAQEQITSGANRVQEYETFFKLCDNTSNMKGNVETQRSLLDDAETSKERSRLRSNIAGMEAAIRKNVSQYNSMSQQYTTDRFKDSSLPVRLEFDGETVCN